MDELTPNQPGQPGTARGRRRRRGRGRGKAKGPDPNNAAAPTAPPARGRPAAPRGSQRGAPRPGRPPAASGSRPQPHRGGSPADEASRSVPKGQLPRNFVYGINPVAVAIDHGQLKTLYYDGSRVSERLQQIHALATDAGLEIRPLQRQGWAKIISGELHQGVAGMLHEPGRFYLEEIVQQVGDDSCILVLDRIQDPQNLGAVLRTAAATGVDAVVLPKAGGCPITPAVHKASAGMSIIVPIVEDENLARALDYLKEHGYWVIGCDSGEGEDATTFEFPRRRVIVMGNEAEGMRRLIKESCDYNVRIPMASDVESLNISVASAVVMYLAMADLARADWSDEGEGNGEDNGESENGGGNGG